MIGYRLKRCGCDSAVAALHRHGGRAGGDGQKQRQDEAAEATVGNLVRHEGLLCATL
jgi:hypothetical protein